MASINLSGILTRPDGEPDVGAVVRFTHYTTTGNTVKYSYSELVIPPDGAYDIDLEYGQLRIDYDSDYKTERFIAFAIVNQDSTATSIPELLNASVPPTDEQLLEFQAILGDTVTAKNDAETAASEAESFAASSTFKQVNTFAELEALSPSEDGLTPKRYICVERANAEYLLQPSGYVAVVGDVTFANGRVAALQVCANFDPRKVGFTGVGDCTDTIKLALERVGDGGSVLLDKSYSFELAGMESDVAATIDFAGSEITSTSTESCIRFNGSFSLESSVSAVSGNIITTTSASSYSAGDVVKITSADEQPDFWADYRYLGQFAVVISASGSDITIDRDIIDSDLYLTDIKLYKLDKRSATVKNVKIKPDASLTNHGELVSMQSLYRPTVENVTTTGSRSKNIKFVSCYKYVCNDCNSSDSLDSAGTSNYGYGVEDASCDGGEVNNYVFNGGRHGFTNNSYASGAAGVTDPKCGYTTNAKINNSQAYDATSGAWDTHPGAVGVTFLNCEAYNSSQFGQSRSRSTRYINPLGSELEYGIRWSTGRLGSTYNPIKDNVVINPTLSCSSAVFESYKASTGSIAITDVSEVVVIGGNVEQITEGYRGPLFECRNTPIKIVMRNLSINHPDGLDTDAIMLLGALAGSSIDVDGISVTAESTGGVAGGRSLVKFISSVTSLDHKVIAQNITFKGVSFEAATNSIVQNADALVSNSRVESITTGSLAAVIGGTRLTWGGEV